MSHDIFLNTNTGQQSDKAMCILIRMHLLTLLKNVPD